MGLGELQTATAIPSNKCTAVPKWKNLLVFSHLTCLCTYAPIQPWLQTEGEDVRDEKPRFCPSPHLCQAEVWTLCRALFSKCSGTLTAVCWCYRGIFLLGISPPTDYRGINRWDLEVVSEFRNSAGIWEQVWSDRLIFQERPEYAVTWIWFLC